MFSDILNAEQAGSDKTIASTGTVVSIVWSQKELKQNLYLSG